jgi:uncharacterized membrane protein HdeD (DUF308 family)
MAKVTVESTTLKWWYYAAGFALVTAGNAAQDAGWGALSTFAVSVAVGAVFLITGDLFNVRTIRRFSDHGRV